MYDVKNTHDPIMCGCLSGCRLIRINSRHLSVVRSMSCRLDDIAIRYGGEVACAYEPEEEEESE